MFPVSTRGAAIFWWLRSGFPRAVRELDYSSESQDDSQRRQALMMCNASNSTDAGAIFAQELAYLFGSVNGRNARRR